MANTARCEKLAVNSQSVFGDLSIRYHSNFSSLQTAKTDSHMLGVGSKGVKNVVAKLRAVKAEVNHAITISSFFRSRTAPALLRPWGEI